jgi:hypothetical protein
LKSLAIRLIDENVSLEGYVVCSVIGKSFDLSFLLSHSSMNTLLHSLELNLALTLLCKLLRLKQHLPLLAFYRALIYIRQGVASAGSSKNSHEWCLEEI